MLHNKRHPYRKWYLSESKDQQYGSKKFDNEHEIGFTDKKIS